MLLETFVIAMCVGGWECSQAPRAYYAQNKELQVMVGESEEKAKRIAGPFVSEYLIPYAMPIVYLSTGKTVRFKLDKHWSLEGNSSEGFVNLQWTW